MCGFFSCFSRDNNSKRQNQRGLFILISKIRFSLNTQCTQSIILAFLVHAIYKSKGVARFFSKIDITDKNRPFAGSRVENKGVKRSVKERRSSRGSRAKFASSKKSEIVAHNLSIKSISRTKDPSREIILESGRMDSDSNKRFLERSARARSESRDRGSSRKSITRERE